MSTTLTEPELREFRGALRDLAHTIGRQLRDDTQCCGLGYLTCHVVLALDAGSGRSLRELEEELGTDKAALSRAVDQLVNAGQVTRKPNPRDRRAVLIALTAAGRRTVREVTAYTDRKYRALFDRLPAGQHGAVIETVRALRSAFAGLYEASASAGRQPTGER